MKLWHRFKKAQQGVIIIDNHFYFITLFLIIFAIHLIHLLVLQKLPSTSTLLCSIPLFLQSLLEVILLVVLGKCVKNKKNSKRIFVLGSFFLVLSHLVDFPLERLFGMSIWQAFHMLANESLGNIIELLYASNISLTTWVLTLSGSFALIFASLYLFHISHRLSTRRPWKLSFKTASSVMCFVPLSLALCQLSFNKYLSTKDLDFIQKALPWKYLLRNQLPFELSPSLGELKKHHTLASFPLGKVLSKKPNIYFFVAESLRRELINENTSPHLDKFRKEFLDYEEVLSSANATMSAWYSIFFSEPAFFWEGKDHRTRGSPNLNFLKQLGYKIHVLSSSRLTFYDMDQTLFGKEYENIDSLTCFRESEEISSYEGDLKAVSTLIEHMKQDKEGNVYIVFLDATHFGYSLPPDNSSLHPFQPYARGINYLKALYSKETLELIKNRYKNALFGMDQLFGKFFKALKDTPQFEESIVLFTADHGEEFYEKGHLFHTSALNFEQTRIPLFVKLGNLKREDRTDLDRLCCHEDIFPTLFHYLFKTSLSQPWGYSLLAEEKRPCVLITKPNFNLPPSEFLLHSKDKKVLFKEESLDLEIVAVTDTFDKPLPSKDTSLESLLEDYQKLIRHNASL